MRSVRRRPHFVSLTSFSLAWGLLVFMLVLPFTASAANVTYETVRVGPGQYAPSGVQTPITVNVKGPGVSKFHQIVPVATPSTIGKLARKLVRGGGVGFAISGAIEGLGYLVDQATGDLSRPEQRARPTEDVNNGGAYGVNSGLGGPGFGSSFCANSTRQYCVTLTLENGNERASTWSCPVDRYGIERWQYREKCYLTSNPPITETVIVPLTEPETVAVYDQIDDILTLSDKTNIITMSVSNASPRGSVDSDNYPVVLTSSNPSTQNLYDSWPELQSLLQKLVNSEIAAYLASIDPEFEISPDEQTIVDSGSDLPPMSLDFIFPSFCEWASFLCEPFVGGDQPDVPMLDLEAPDYDSGLPSGGTCPQPYTFNTGFTGPMQISFQPACDLAMAIRTPLIAISYLMAGFIVVGVRR